MRATVSKAYFDLPWGQVHCRSVAGACAGAPLLLLHQSPLSSRNYERLLPLLAGQCRPYAFDTPGYGESSPVPESWEVSDYAAMVWKLADALGAGKVFLFGRATGAVFAMAAALAQPQRVLGLVLHGMPVYTDEERTNRMAGFAPPFVPQADGSHIQDVWTRIRGEYPWIDPELATHFVRDFLSAGPDFARSYRAIWRYDLPAHVRGPLGFPTLLIGGGRDRIAFMHARAQALLPAAESVFLEDATDFVAEQDAPLMAEHLNEFMARHA